MNRDHLLRVGKYLDRQESRIIKLDISMVKQSVYEDDRQGRDSKRGKLKGASEIGGISPDSLFLQPFALYSKPRISTE